MRFIDSFFRGSHSRHVDLGRLISFPCQTSLHLIHDFVDSSVLSTLMLCSLFPTKTALKRNLYGGTYALFNDFYLRLPKRSPILGSFRLYLTLQIILLERLLMESRA